MTATFPNTIGFAQYFVWFLYTYVKMYPALNDSFRTMKHLRVNSRNVYYSIRSQIKTQVAATSNKVADQTHI